MDTVELRKNTKSQGLARALVQMSLPSVRAAGYYGIVAFVTEGNKPSEKLLVNLGFRMVQ